MAGSKFHLSLSTARLPSASSNTVRVGFAPKMFAHLHTCVSNSCFDDCCIGVALVWHDAIDGVQVQVGAQVDALDYVMPLVNGAIKQCRNLLFADFLVRSCLLPLSLCACTCCLARSVWMRLQVAGSISRSHGAATPERSPTFSMQKCAHFCTWKTHALALFH